MDQVALKITSNIPNHNYIHQGKMSEMGGGESEKKS